MLKLHDFLPSGNCYKVRALLAYLGVAFERCNVDILAGESRTAEFLARNPNGRVPVLELEDGHCLGESNAILWYLAEAAPGGERFLPAAALDRAEVLRWMFFEQYSHEPYIATVRFWIAELEQADAYRDEIEKRRPAGRAALEVMDRHLAGREFFVGDACSLADIALYAYTHVAGEGGYDLAPYGAVRAWLDRIAARPGHIVITDDCGTPAS